MRYLKCVTAAMIALSVSVVCAAPNERADAKIENQRSVTRRAYSYAPPQVPAPVQTAAPQARVAAPATTNNMAAQPRVYRRYSYTPAANNNRFGMYGSYSPGFNWRADKKTTGSF